MNQELIYEIADTIYNKLEQPRKSVVAEFEIGTSTLSITAYFDAYVCSEGDNISSPHYSDYEDVEVEITEASAIGEDNEEYTIPDSDLEQITEQIAQRI